MCRDKNRPATLLWGSIPIVYKRLEDSNNKNRDFKAKIYHIVLKTIVEHI